MAHLKIAECPKGPSVGPPRPGDAIAASLLARLHRACSGCEWPTVALFTLSIVTIGATLAVEASAVSFVLLVLALTLHASLSHEILHGHPFRSERAGTLLGLVQPGLFVPYLRFRALHLAHHRDAHLTDPYDDPETNFLAPHVWRRLPYWKRMALSFNNTLLGRMVIGPLIGTLWFWRDDIRRIRSGDRAVVVHWLLHLPGVALVLGGVTLSPVPIWAYLCACYAAQSMLKIRSFLEHRAHPRASGRTVVVEDRGLLAILFLNNNLHVVHHMYPQVPWYRLPALYKAQKDRFLRRNHGYVYRSYGQVFRHYLLRAKDPVVHPLWQERSD